MQDVQSPAGKVFGTLNVVTYDNVPHPNCTHSPVTSELYHPRVWWPEKSSLAMLGIGF